MLSNEAQAISRTIETIKKSLSGDSYESTVKICNGKIYDDVRDICAKLVSIADAFALGAGRGSGEPSIAVINQPEYADASLQELLAQSSSLATANYFMSDASSVWKFDDIIKAFTIKSLDGASRVAGDGESVRIYYQRDQVGQVAANSETYHFLGPALFHGLDGYSGDISAITAANLQGWMQRQIDELLIVINAFTNSIQLGSLDTLTVAGNKIVIPFVDTQVTHHDPFDMGQFENEAQLPQPAPQNEAYYAGIAERGNVEKYVPSYIAGADTQFNPVQMFENDAPPSALAGTFNELRIGAIEKTVDEFNA
jgi:hypothetical protein